MFWTACDPLTVQTYQFVRFDKFSRCRRKHNARKVKNYGGEHIRPAYKSRKGMKLIIRETAWVRSAQTASRLNELTAPLLYGLTGSRAAPRSRCFRASLTSLDPGVSWPAARLLSRVEKDRMVFFGRNWFACGPADARVRGVLCRRRPAGAKMSELKKYSCNCAGLSQLQ